MDYTIENLKQQVEDAVTNLKSQTEERQIVRKIQFPVNDSESLKERADLPVEKYSNEMKKLGLLLFKARNVPLPDGLRSWYEVPAIQ
jgi:hypothetical protein